MKVAITTRAALAAERIADHWREHGDDPHVFAREFAEAIDLLATVRSVGAPFPTPRHPDAKRLLLRKARCHVYFKIDDATQTIRILHVWDGRRARTPKL